MYIYCLPCYKSTNSYHSFFSSLLFIPLSFIISDFTSLPKWYSYILFLVGFISSAHHIRSYGQENAWYDIIRYLDVFLANIFGSCMIYFYHNSKYFYILGSLLILFFFMIIYYFKSNRIKTQLHAIFHIIVVIIIFMESLYPQNIPITYK